MSKFLEKDILIGIDHGEKNTGVALGRNGLVSPLTVISGGNDSIAIHEIVRMGMENRVVGYVMGLPLDAQEKETKQSLKVRQFAKLLKTISKKPVEFQNEHGSSIEAMKEAIDAGVSQRKRRVNDHFSAAVILKDFYSGMTAK
jgi:putative holliday junction resolvase